MDDILLGTALAELWFTRSHWIRRRTEKILLSNTTRCRRTILLDCDLLNHDMQSTASGFSRFRWNFSPSPYLGLEYEVGTRKTQKAPDRINKGESDATRVAPIPVSVFKKFAALADLRVQIMMGETMTSTVLTAAESNALVTRAILKSLFTRAGISTHDAVVTLAERIVTRPAHLAERDYQEFLDYIGPYSIETAATSSERSDTLLELRTLLADLVHGYLAFVLVPTTHHRLQVEISFDERITRWRPLPTTSGLSHERVKSGLELARQVAPGSNTCALLRTSEPRILSRLKYLLTLGGHGLSFVAFFRSLADGYSSHVELEVPDDVEILQARCVLRTSERLPSNMGLSAHYGRRTWITVAATDVGPRAHLYLGRDARMVLSHMAAHPRMDGDELDVHWAPGLAAVAVWRLRLRGRELARSASLLAFAAAAGVAPIGSAKRPEVAVALVAITLTLVATTLASRQRSELGGYLATRLNFSVFAVVVLVILTALLMVSGTTGWPRWLCSAVLISIAGVGLSAWRSFSREPSPERGALNGLRGMACPSLLVDLSDPVRSHEGDRTTAEIADLYRSRGWKAVERLLRGA